MIKFMLKRSKNLPSFVPSDNRTADCSIVKTKRKGAMAFGMIMLVVGVAGVGFFVKRNFYDPRYSAGGGGGGGMGGGGRYSAVSSDGGDGSSKDDAWSDEIRDR